MSQSTSAQRDALRRLWPAIGDYCAARGLSQGNLLGGNLGIPVDRVKLAAERNRQFMSRADLASRAGVTRDAVAKIENGVRSPTPAVLDALLTALSLTPDSLLLAAPRPS